MKKLLILIASFLVIGFSTAQAENKIASITTQTNIVDYVLKNSKGTIKNLSVNTTGSSLIQDSKDEKEFKNFLLKQTEELPNNSNVLISPQHDGYYKIIITSNNNQEISATGIGKNFSEALKSLEYKLDLD